MTFHERLKRIEEAARNRRRFPPRSMDWFFKARARYLADPSPPTPEESARQRAETVAFYERKLAEGVSLSTLPPPWFMTRGREPDDDSWTPADDRLAELWEQWLEEKRGSEAQA